MQNHVVAQGECLSSIAAKYKFPDWETIYQHAANADFRNKRPDPNIIFPGDQLVIPDIDLRIEQCATEKRHCFVLQRMKTFLNVRIQDLEQKPIANAAYKLKLDGTDQEFTGTTDGDGWINAVIPAVAETGTLSIQPDLADPDLTIQWSVQLGHLDPLETVSGIKGRLNNLGYACGDINQTQDDRYEAAVREYQQDRGLVVDGIVGPKTRGQLNQEHFN
jgi:N-acetylmuramoyl-L-alanine amidase